MKSLSQRPSRILQDRVAKLQLEEGLDSDSGEEGVIFSGGSFGNFGYCPISRGLEDIHTQNEIKRNKYGERIDDSVIERQDRAALIKMFRKEGMSNLQARARLMVVEDLVIDLTIEAFKKKKECSYEQILKMSQPFAIALLMREHKLSYVDANTMYDSFVDSLKHEAVNRNGIPISKDEIDEVYQAAYEATRRNVLVPVSLLRRDTRTGKEPSMMYDYIMSRAEHS